MPDGQVLQQRRPRQAHRQSGALPILVQGAATYVVLITSRETRRWVIPKGWIEPGEPPHLSAAREAFEEAGLEGEAEAAPLGTYTYGKRMPHGLVTQCEVLVYPFAVTRLLRQWPERRQRTRRLFSPAAAAEVVQEAGLAEILRGLGGEVSGA
jgi:8-oxo-dGTP pyrophosphatase MutT (NUDIX family)